MALYDLAFLDGTPYPTIPLGTTVVNVSTSSALSTALANAVAGHDIVIANGNYSGSFAMSNKLGTATAGISIRAATPGGAVFDSASTWRITNCAYVTVSGISRPSDPAGDFFQFRGTSHHCQLIQSTIGPTTGPTGSANVSNWIYVGDDCYHIRIAFNELRNKGTGGNGIRVYGNFDKVDAGQGSSAGCRWVRIDDNLLRNFGPEATNDKEPIRYGVSTMSRTIANGAIERNVFQDIVAEPEVISGKMGGLKIVGNSLIRCAGSICYRHGTNGLVADNHIVDRSGTITTPTQTLGVGGVGTPSGAILTTSDSSSALNITTSGTATNPRVYDGQGHTVGRINVTASYVVVQNFRINAQSQYGALLDGNNITFQNNDITGVKVSGDGDLNAITAFGNNIKIKFNTAISFISGDPGDSHSDAIQTWVSSSHPVASSNWEIIGNKFTGPANPSRSNSVASIHQCIMAEDYGRGGNSGGSSSGMSNWLIADNEFGDSWNQCIKLDGVDNVNITRNKFVGSSDKVVDLGDGASGVKFWSDNTVGSGYGSVGVNTTSGSGPASL
jgi:chondroitinase B-like protein